MDISGGGVKESTEDIKMRSGAVITGAVLLATLHVILANQDVKNNNLAQKTEKEVRTKTILTDNENMQKYISDQCFCLILDHSTSAIHCVLGRGVISVQNALEIATPSL